MALAGTALVGAAEFKGKGLKMDGEHKAQVEEAIESGDYNTFRELMGDKGRLAEVITEDNFDQFIQLHELKSEGKFEEAKELAKELDLGIMKGRFHKNKGEWKKDWKFEDKNGDGVCDHLDKK